jgi:hypothetical protein
MYLKPIGVTWSGTPRRAATRSRRSEVENVFAMPPEIRPRLREALGEEGEDPMRRHEAAGRRARRGGRRRRRSRGRRRNARQRASARGAEVLRDRLGIDAPEERIAIRAQRRDAGRMPAPTISSRSVPAAPCIASKRTLRPARRIASRSTAAAIASP